VRAAGLVRGALHDGLRDQRAEVVEFGSAGLGEAARDGPDGAVVEVDAEVAFGDRFEVGEVALFVEQRGEDGDLVVDALASESVFGVVDHLAASTIEDPANQCGFLGFHVFEEFDRQGVCGRGEQWFGECRGLISVSRASCVSVIFMGDNQSGSAERCQVLANGAGRNFECGGEFVGGDFAVPLEYFEDVPLRWRQVHDVGHNSQ